MDEQKFSRIFDELNQYRGVEEVFLLGSDGAVIFQSPPDFSLDSEEVKGLLKSWKEKEPSINFQSNRYAILKNDEIQLAAKNIAGGKGNIAGSITKEGDYLIAHIAQDTDIILLEWSIIVNKLAWS